MLSSNKPKTARARCARATTFAVSASVVLGFGLPTAASGEPGTLRVGGTGAAKGALERLGAAFQAETGIPIEIVQNLGSSGGIRALADGVLDLSVSGRPLKTEEAAGGLRISASFRTPFVLVTSHTAEQSLTSAAVSALYGDPNATWPDGTPVAVVLRPRSDSDMPLMAQSFPGFAGAYEAARKRPEVQIAAMDQDNAALAERLNGSLTGMTYLQLNTERPNLRFIQLDGVAPSLEALEAGAYPHCKTLHVVSAEPPSPTVARFVAFLRAPAGESILREAGAALTRNDVR